MAIYPTPPPDSSLAAIQDLVRRVTRSPSEASLTTDELNDFINTAVLYDFPAELRLFALRQKFYFYTQPGVDTYSTQTTNPNDPLYDFDNKYITVHPSVYFNGIIGYYTQYVDSFYANYPQTEIVNDTTLRGNGTTGPFIGNMLGSIPSNIPNPVPAQVLQNSVTLQALDMAGTSMVLIDYPQSNVFGYLGVPLQTDILTNAYGNIYYITGEIQFSFPRNTLSSPDNIIYSTGYYYQPGLPLAMLYFNNTFTIRPVPDKVYTVQIEVDARPTQLLFTSSVPQVGQWWTYIGFLAAKRILEARVDTETLAQIQPMLRRYENLVNRTNLDQQANERTVTIYTQSKNYGVWGGWFGQNWPF
jgi:hypothetical protein